MSVFFVAMLCATAIGRTIEFEERQWIVKSSEEGLIGPGPNYWSDSNESVWVDDANALHLKIRNDGIKWYCAEVYTELPTVHGKHRFYVDSRVDQLDRNVVVGLFLYKSDDEEIDIEFAEWGIEDGNNAWYVVQRPGTKPPPEENKKGFDITLTGDYSTHYIDWQSSFINFKSFHGHYEEPPTPDYLIDEWTYSGSDNPPESSNLKIHLNLWLHDPCEVQGLPPSDGQEVEIVIKRADFPAVGQAKYGGGTGEPNDPYLIYTAAQMNAIGTDSNDWDKHFKLMADIDLIAFTGTSFNIIGTNQDNPFTGVFDGNEHTISNFTYDSTDADYIGVFGLVGHWENDGEIKDLVLVDPNVDAGTGSSVGSLVGRLQYGNITNCYAEGGSVSGDSAVGGLVGFNYGTITNCYSTADVSGNYGTGGLVGYNANTISDCYATGYVAGERIEDNYPEETGGLVGSNSGKISNCYATGGVWGSYGLGGLAGENEDGLIIDSYATGGVSGDWVYGYHVGGLVGRNRGTISGCYATGSVCGDSIVGGLVGENEDATIIACYARGRVTEYYHSEGESAETGGLVGSNSYRGSVINCYATGYVEAISEWGFGGLVGGSSGGIVLDSFWDTETSQQSYSAGGTGKTTVEMMIESTFTDAGWDFVSDDRPSDEWGMPDAGGYPILWWQLSPLPPLPTFSGGTGDANDPYLISTPNELNRIGHNPRLMDKHYLLAQNIDLLDNPLYIIGNAGYRFDGVFDGNEQIVSNFSVSSTNTNDTGSFGFVGENGTIRNLGLEDVNIEASDSDYVGGLAGHNRGTIINCHVTGSIEGNENVGGLVGEGYYTGVISNSYVMGFITGNDHTGGLLGSSEGTISNCHAAAPVTGNNWTGGLVGYNWGPITNCYSAGDVSGDEPVGGLVGVNACPITNCYSESDASGDDYVGGLVGRNYQSAITNCYAKGDVSASDIIWGGVGGLAGSDYRGEITNSYSTGSVTGTTNVGGLMGKNRYSTVYNCYATSSASGDSKVGGLVGYNDEESIVSNCYSTGSVTGTTNVGGLIGYDTSGSFTKSFWDNIVNSSLTGIGNTSDANVMGESTTNMQTESTFTDAGWDFVGETANGTKDIWRLCVDGTSYPQLDWQFLLGDLDCPDGVDVYDLAVLCEQWLQIGAYSADIAPLPARDGIVNFLDFAVLARDWLAGGSN